MNQILDIKDKNNNKNSNDINKINNISANRNKNNSRKIFKIQFIFSIIVLCFLLYIIIYSIYSIQKTEKMSSTLISNYNIYKLYQNISTSRKGLEIENKIFGTIEIPKISISYPIFSDLNEENLKTSPCKFFGPELGKKGNICIAGHNYDNNKFFSNLKLLSVKDLIFITDNYDNKFAYSVFDSYEVKETDLSPIFDYNENNNELTLITCNNFNGNRLVIKAIEQK